MFEWLKRSSRSQSPVVQANTSSVAVGGDIRDSTINIGLDEEGVGRKISHTQQPILEQLSLIKDNLVRLSASSSIVDQSGGSSSDPAEIAVQAKIDLARDRIRAGQPKTALTLLRELISANWETASSRAKFRLLTNQGAAEYNLGNLNEAAELLLKAEPFGGYDPLARGNVVLALLLRNEVQEARRRADAILQEDPGNAFVASLRVLTAFDEEGVDDPFSIVPSEHADNAEIVASAARWHRHRGHTSECRRLFERAFALNPGIDHIQAELAVAFLEPILSGGYTRFAAGLTGDDRNDFDRGVQLLSTVWNRVRDTELAANNIPTALNLVGTLRFADRMEEAEKVLAEALLVAPDDRQLNLHRAQMNLLAGEPEKALSLLDTFPASVGVDIDLLTLRAEACMAAKRFDEAFQVFDKLGSLSEVKHGSVLELDRVRSLWKAGRHADASNAAQNLVSRRGTDPASYAALSFVKREAGDIEGAREAALKALERLPSSNDQSVYFIADALYAVEEWDAVADLLAPIASPTQSSDLLHWRLGSLIFSDRRKEAADLLDKLAPEIKAQPYYLRCAATLYARAGDLHRARQSCEEYLRLHPDLYLRLKWLEIVDRLDDQSAREARDAFLDSDMVAYDDAAVALRMELARVLDHHDRPERAFAIAYATLRQHWQDPEAHISYAGLFFQGKADCVIGGIDCIGPNVAFTVAAEYPGAPSATYVIEPRLRPINRLLGELAPDDDLARRVDGLRVGDRIKLNDNPGAEEREIAEVKHKYLHLFHRSQQDFSALFPSERRLFSLSIPPHAPEKGIEKIHDIVRQRRDHVDKVWEFYKSNPAPLAMIARLAGGNPIDAWAGLIDARIPFDVCFGSEPERHAAFELLRNSPPLILDPLTFWIAGCLNVLNVLADTYGPLGLTSSAVSMLECCRDERALNVRYEGGCMTAGDVDGKIVVSQYSLEHRQAALKLAETILRFAKSDRVAIIPAIPDRDFDGTARQFASMMDPSVVDVIAAASNSRRIFLCEDHRLRWLADHASSVKGAWLQPALYVAQNAGRLPAYDYNRIVAKLALMGHHFTSINCEILLQAAERNDWSPEGEFGGLAKLLGGPDLELQSLLGVAGDFLRHLWNGPVEHPKRKALTIAILSGVTAGRGNMASKLLLYLLVHGRPPKNKSFKRHLHIRSSYQNCIRQWAKDNNIGLV